MLHLFQVLLFSIVFLFFSCSGAKYREICRITPEYTNCSDGYCGGKDMLKLFPNNSKIINASNRFLLCESIRNVFYKNIQESLKKIQEQASHNSINVKESYKLNEIIEEQLDIKIAEWFSNNFLDLKKGVGLDEKNIGKQLGKIMQKRIINNFKAFNNENKNLNIKSLSLLNNIVKEWFFNNTNDFKKPDEKNTREQLNTIIQELLAGIFEIVGIKVPEQSHNTHDSTITKSNNLDLNGNGLSVEDIASSHLGSYCIISMGERFFYIPLLLTKQVSSCNMHKSKPVPTQRRRNDYINQLQS
ncbi:hypothetical protein [Cardinium endosymbiont of Culicoides punctatus]|uniref:hypothetical protein n=1 Tax=Cardinium endosymbiont of Culicoides punctatus TaxID=2304601 RepID=UPI001058D582|nr:hypothetical protein [Cardinium endosymbiont of Culicoides punctatus]TDG95528.1 hypothetical protein CCPUN_02640 [Cardinium endosymbiont of Culicoides punctatus]